MRDERSKRDEGFTLVEMIVAAATFSLVAITVMGVLLTTITTEAKVRTVTTAANQAQLVTRTLDGGITNAAVPLSLTTAGSDQFLRARVAGAGAIVSWTCEAWYYSAQDRTIRMTSSAAAIAQPTVEQQRSWTLLADTANPKGGSTAVFSLVGTVGVSVAFTVDAGDAPDVVLESVFTSQSRVTSGGSPCY